MKEFSLETLYMSEFGVEEDVEDQTAEQTDGDTDAEEKEMASEESILENVFAMESINKYNSMAKIDMFNNIRKDYKIKNKFLKSLENEENVDVSGYSGKTQGFTVTFFKRLVESIIKLVKYIIQAIKNFITNFTIDKYVKSIKKLMNDNKGKFDYKKTMELAAHAEVQGEFYVPTKSSNEPLCGKVIEIAKKYCKDIEDVLSELDTTSTYSNQIPNEGQNFDKSMSGFFKRLADKRKEGGRINENTAYKLFFGEEITLFKTDDKNVMTFAKYMGNSNINVDTMASKVKKSQMDYKEVNKTLEKMNKILDYLKAGMHFGAAVGAISQNSINKKSGSSERVKSKDYRDMMVPAVKYMQLIGDAIRVIQKAMLQDLKLLGSTTIKFLQTIKSVYYRATELDSMVKVNRKGDWHFKLSDYTNVTKSKEKSA